MLWIDLTIVFFTEIHPLGINIDTSNLLGFTRVLFYIDMFMIYRVCVALQVEEARPRADVEHARTPVAPPRDHHPLALDEVAAEHGVVLRGPAS